MAEILPGVHEVEGSGERSEFGTNVYLLKDPGGTWTMVDTGLPGKDAEILAYLKRQEIAPSSVRSILLTHLHLDHTGNLRRLQHATRAKTYAHWIEAAFIANHPKYDGPGMAPKESVEVDERLKDGDAIDAGGGLVAYHTPGHTPGHTAYYAPARRLLFAGDLLFGDGPSAVILTVPQYTHHTPTAQVSARRVARLDIDAIVMGHGGPFPARAGALLKKLVEKL